MFAQWDDHEVTNNWYWEKRMDADQRYTEKSVAILAASGTRAFLEYMPIRRHPDRPRPASTASSRYGPQLDVFRIDMRSYRGPNTANTQTDAGPETAFLGRDQIGWLKQALLASDATWKVIAADMPLGLIVYDDGRRQDAAPRRSPRATAPPSAASSRSPTCCASSAATTSATSVWLTADVHYCAAHYYDPNKAQFQDFEPFWEFVSGPLNAGTFGPNELDDTFGPQLMFVKAPPAGQSNLPPSAGLQFFGQVDIERRGHHAGQPEGPGGPDPLHQGIATRRVGAARLPPARKLAL